MVSLASACGLRVGLDGGDHGASGDPVIGGEGQPDQLGQHLGAKDGCMRVPLDSRVEPLGEDRDGCVEVALGLGQQRFRHGQTAARRVRGSTRAEVWDVRDHGDVPLSARPVTSAYRDQRGRTAPCPGTT